MKILCPTDFSACSINAIDWILSYTRKLDNVELEILHCIEHYGSIYESMVEQQKKQAFAFFKLYEEKILSIYPNAKFSTNITLANPKSYIIERAKVIGANYIVIGTAGLSDLKDINIGSVAEYVISRTTIPTLCVPPNAKFDVLKKIILGVDENEIEHPVIVSQLKGFITNNSPQITLAQVRKKKAGQNVLFDMRIEEYLEEFELIVENLEFNYSVANTLNEHANSICADLVCLLHRKKSWFRDLIQKSTAKEGLYELETPLLILSD